MVFNGNAVSYDLDGNMLSNGTLTCTYDPANKLVSAGGHTYTYNAENVRIRNLCADEDTTYTYDTNCKLSKLLCKTTNGVTTKYVYGRGLIGEEVGGTFKTYHFDCRGSTIAITDASGNITDTFAYDTYGKLISRTGTNKVIFGYNGRDGVVTDDNGLIYMRARYYSPDMKRFINADIVAGEISNAITLNRFAYVNGNPVLNIDPLGLSVLLTLGIMALGGAVVAAVNAIGSVVEQKKTHGEVDAKEVLVDAAWGFVDGFVSASPAGPVVKVASDALISLGNQLTDAYFDSKNEEDGEFLRDLDPLQILSNMALDTIFSATEIKDINQRKIAYQNLEILEDVKKRESRRVNEKVAKKRMKDANKKIFDFGFSETIKDSLPNVKSFVHNLVSDQWNYLYDNYFSDYVTFYANRTPIGCDGIGYDSAVDDSNEGNDFSSERCLLNPS